MTSDSPVGRRAANHIHVHPVAESPTPYWPHLGAVEHDIPTYLPPALTQPRTDRRSPTVRRAETGLPTPRSDTGGSYRQRLNLSYTGVNSTADITVCCSAAPSPVAAILVFLGFDGCWTDFLQRQLRHSSLALHPHHSIYHSCLSVMSPVMLCSWRTDVTIAVIESWGRIWDCEQLPSLISCTVRPISVIVRFVPWFAHSTYYKLRGCNVFCFIDWRWRLARLVAYSNVEQL